MTSAMTKWKILLMTKPNFKIWAVTHGVAAHILIIRKKKESTIEKSAGIRIFLYWRWNYHWKSDIGEMVRCCLCGYLLYHGILSVFLLLGHQMIFAM